jgi:hypothetical protein
LKKHIALNLLTSATASVSGISPYTFLFLRMRVVELVQELRFVLCANVHL